MDEDKLLERTRERARARQLCGEVQSTRNYKLLLPKVIQLMAHSDIGVKRITYSTYAKHSHKVPGEALLAINTLLQDSCHPSPLVRSLVLNTLGFIHNESAAGIHRKIISDGLTDTSAFVRRHAVVSQYYFSLADSNQHESLKVLIDDPDPLVSTLSLVTSREHSDPHSLALHCLRRIQGYTTEGIATVVGAVRSYLPDGQDQLLDILNVLDPLLDSDQIDVVVMVMDIFLRYSQLAEKSLAKDIHTRLLKCCLTFMRCSDADQLYCILLWLQECLRDNPIEEKTTPTGQKLAVSYELISDNYHLLLDRSIDPPHVCLLKLDLLALFVTEANVTIVTDNIKSILNSRCKDGHICDKVIRMSIAARQKFPDSFGKLLMELLETSEKELQVCLLRHVHRIALYGHTQCEQLFQALLSRWKQLVPSDLVALLNLSSQFAFKNAENVEHMKAIAESVLAVGSRVCKVALIHSLVECFLVESAEYHGCLIKCLNDLEKDSDEVVKQEVGWAVLKLKQCMEL